MTRLDQVAVAVIGGTTSPGRDLADGLTALGAQVVVAEAGSDVGGALDTVDRERASARAVVWAWTEPAATTPRSTADLDEATWARLAEEPLTHFLRCLQSAHGALLGGGSLVAVVPTVAMVGAAGLVPWAAVAEGQRSLAKIAARTWGTDGIRVNCVAVPPELLAVGDRATPALQRPGLPAPSLAEEPDLRGDVARVVAALLSDDWRAVTGMTVAVDGGVWMTP